MTARIALDLDALIAGYRAGATLKQLAERHGVSLSVVYRRLEAAGEPRRRSGWNPPKKARA